VGLSNDAEKQIVATIEEFPEPHRSNIMGLWNKWLATNPEPPFYSSWSDFSDQYDDSSSLYNEQRIYLKRVKNELRDLEVPLTLWQKIAKGLAAVASVFLVVFLALSRVARGSD
jgi:hypothetical protein